MLLNQLDLIPEEVPIEAKPFFDERYIALRQTLSLVSQPDLLQSPTSPQYQTLDWLASKDEMKLSVDAPNLLQRYVLALVYFSTSGEQWHRDMNWLSDKHECEWNGDGGVRSCDEDKQVTDLSLWNNLKGTIPNEIGKLSKLQVLYLARNDLVGTLPTEIGLLTDLSYLGVHHNRLEGTVPGEYMSNMLKLRTMYVEKNDFVGTIERDGFLCQLKHDANPLGKAKRLDGVLHELTADCKTLVSWKQPEIACNCCTKCYAA